MGGGGRRRKVVDGIRTHNIRAAAYLRPGSSISTSILSCVQKLLAEQNLNLIFARAGGERRCRRRRGAGMWMGFLGMGNFRPGAETAAMRRIPAALDDEPGGILASGDAWGDRVKSDNQVAIGRMAAESGCLPTGGRHLAFFNPDAGTRQLMMSAGAMPRAALLELRAESFSVLMRLLVPLSIQPDQ